MFKRSFFYPLGQTDVKKLALVVGTVAVLWMGLNELIPESYYHKISVVISAVQSALIFLMRGGIQNGGTRSEDPKENK